MPAGTADPTLWQRRRNSRFGWATPQVRPDLIFGKDRDIGGLGTLKNESRIYACVMISHRRQRITCRSSGTPPKKVFKRNAPLACGKHSVTLQAVDFDVITVEVCDVQQGDAMEDGDRSPTLAAIIEFQGKSPISGR